MQINGKVRFSVDVAPPPTEEEGGEEEQEGEEMIGGLKGEGTAERRREEEGIVKRVLETEEGKVWLREKNDWEKRKRVVVVKGGRLVNVVF